MATKLPQDEISVCRNFPLLSGSKICLKRCANGLLQLHALPVCCENTHTATEVSSPMAHMYNRCVRLEMLVLNLKTSGNHFMAAHV